MWSKQNGRKNNSWLDAEPWACFEDSWVESQLFFIPSVHDGVRMRAAADTYIHAAHAVFLCEQFWVKKRGGGWG